MIKSGRKIRSPAVTLIGHSGDLQKKLELINCQAFRFSISMFSFSFLQVSFNCFLERSSNSSNNKINKKKERKNV